MPNGVVTKKGYGKWDIWLLRKTIHVMPHRRREKAIASRTGVIEQLIRESVDSICRRFT